MSSPIADPATYPGTPVPGSCIVTHDAIISMRVEPEGWTVDLDGKRLDVDSALGRLNGAAPLSERKPVLAIGSNASSGQLRRKWREDPKLAVPVTTARTTGIGVGFSAHVSRAGYVPYAPMLASGLETAYVALWLTSDEVDDLNVTEPNYHPTWIDGTAFPAVLESGQRLSEYLLYRSKWGVLADSEGVPIPAASQGTALEFIASIASSNTELGSDSELRAAASARLAAQAVDDGF
ncbi:hypothetical protein GCM10027447_16700 [Glycomyces halotolerans]